MPIKIKISIENMDWGQVVYIVDDPYQNPARLLGLQFDAHGKMTYLIKQHGDIEAYPYYDFEFALEPGEKVKDDD